MNICIDVRLLSRGKTSGIEEYTRLLLDHIFRADTKNSYLLFYNGLRKKPLPAEWLINSRVSCINTRIPNKLFELSERILRWPPVDYFGDSDIVFSPHFNILRTKASTKRVITFHDLSFVHFPEFYSWRKRYWHWMQDCKREAKRAGKIVAVSEFTKNDLVRTFGIPAEKIEVIYPAPNPNYKKFERNDIRLEHFKRKYKISFPYLLYTGVLEPRKNIIAIIRAFTILKQKKAFTDFKLIIVGERGWLYDKILSEAYHSRASSDIIFWGNAAQDDLVYLYNCAHAFAYPSFFEGFGFPPLEAQACGVPVIASNRTSLPEILNDSAILIDPWRVDELVFALENALLNTSVRDKLVARGAENVRRFSWQRSAQKLQTLFNTL